jgi:toxin ParE1/3/4
MPPASQGMRLKVKLTQSAQRDLSQLLRWTQEQFGLESAQKYLRLIQAALTDLSIQPDRLGVRELIELRDSMRSYHLRYSRNSLPTPQRIKQPRHLLLFRVSRNRLQITRILHDSMDVATHLLQDPL